MMDKGKCLFLAGSFPSTTIVHYPLWWNVILSGFDCFGDVIMHDDDDDNNKDDKTISMVHTHMMIDIRTRTEKNNDRNKADQKFTSLMES